MVVLIALTFNGFDIVTGIIKGIKADKKLDSSKLRDGLFKKMGFVLCYGFGGLLDYSSGYIDIPIDTSMVMPAICGFVILTECVSIIENLTQINPDIMPEKLKELIGWKGE